MFHGYTTRLVPDLSATPRPPMTIMPVVCRINLAIDEELAFEHEVDFRREFHRER